MHHKRFWLASLKLGYPWTIGIPQTELYECLSVSLSYLNLDILIEFISTDKVAVYVQLFF